MKFRLFVLMMLAAIVGFAQEGFKGEHFIEVNGVAQLEVEPNEITVMVRLREFEENRQKVSLEKLDQDFLNALKNAGIDKKRLELSDVGSQLSKLRRKDKDAFRDKTYQIKLTSAVELEKFLEKIEPVKVDQADIVKIHHTELEKMRLDLKIKALQAAKTKAEALLKGIGGEIGKILMVREWEEQQPYQPVYNMRMANTVEQYKLEENPAAEESIGFKKIQLRSQVTAQFEIK